MREPFVNIHRLVKRRLIGVLSQLQLPAGLSSQHEYVSVKGALRKSGQAEVQVAATELQASV